MKKRSFSEYTLDMLRGVAFLLSFASLSAQATTFFERPFPEVVQDASTIVRGKIGNSSSSSATALDGTERMYTYYELQIDEVFKGNVEGRSMTIREMGGERDGVGMYVAGAAQFTRGEDVVVLLGEKNADSSFDIRGLMMGKYNLEKGSDGKDYLIGAGITAEQHLLQRRKPEETGGQADTPTAQKWSVEALRNLVRTQAQAPEEREKSHDISAVSSDLAHPPSKPSPAVSPAPQLHTSSLAESTPSSEEKGALRWLLYLGGAGAFGVFFCWLFGRRS